MGGIPDRQLLLMTVVLSALAVVVTVVSSGGDWVAALISLPIFVTVSFWSLKLSRWLGRRVNPRPPQSEPAALEPTPQTTDRPEHAQRRRQRRRPRGRR